MLRSIVPSTSEHEAIVLPCATPVGAGLMVISTESLVTQLKGSGEVTVTLYLNVPGVAVEISILFLAPVLTSDPLLISNTSHAKLLPNLPASRNSSLSPWQ